MIKQTVLRNTFVIILVPHFPTYYRSPPSLRSVFPTKGTPCGRSGHYNVHLVGGYIVYRFPSLKGDKIPL